ncbi:hypothetical protein [uncultured Nostoc sp.]
MSLHCFFWHSQEITVTFATSTEEVQGKNQAMPSLQEATQRQHCLE